jgi:Zn-dependent protease with chaperone function
MAPGAKSRPVRSAALAALATMIALLALFYFAGVPYLADRIALSLPPSVETSLGETALSALESRGILQTSRLSDERIAEVRALLPYAMPAHPRRAARLLVRDSTFGANAITLPDGTIIVTDTLVRLMVNEKGDLDGNGKARLLGVLGHEVGHLEQRHITRALAGSSLVAALSASLFGDFSAVAAGVPAVLTRMEFSRDMELAADDYAIGVLHGLRISPLVLADALADLKRGHPDGAALPRWMRTAVNYLSTHPDTDERIARIQAAAR